MIQSRLQLRRRVDALGLAHADLARLVGCSRQQLSNWFNKRSLPKKNRSLSDRLYDAVAELEKAIEEHEKAKARGPDDPPPSLLGPAVEQSEERRKRLRLPDALPELPPRESEV